MKIPKYQYIRKELEKEIKSGAFTSGDLFYTEKELAQRFGVSSITVIRAVQELVNDGFLVREQGKGTFISRSRKRTLVEFSDIEVFDPSKDHVTVVSIKEMSDKAIQEKLNIKTSYFQIVRVRSFEGEPYFIQTSYIPARYINIEQANENPSYYESIYHRYKTDFGINVMEQNYVESNEVIFPTPEPICKQLAMKPEEPTVLQIKLTKMKNTEEVLEYVVSYKKWNYYKIEFYTDH